MEKQKTAVDFLYEFVLLKLTNEQQMQFEGLFTQAKHMEKEQIRDAFNAGDTSSSDFFIPFLKSMDESEVYYESKYGKDEDKAENND